MVADFLRYYTEPQYLMVSKFYLMSYYTITTISHDFRFYEILHQYLIISWLNIIRDITPKTQYLMLADFARYFTSTTILELKVWKLHVIFCQVTIYLIFVHHMRYFTRKKYLIVSDFMRCFIKISHG